MKVYAYGAMLVRLLYREHGLSIVIVPYAQYFRPTINDVSYISIVSGSSLLEALRSYCCQSSVSIWMDAGSQH